MDETSPIPYIVLAAVVIGLVVFYLTWNKRSRPVTPPRDRAPAPVERDRNDSTSK